MNFRAVACSFVARLQSRSLSRLLYELRTLFRPSLHAIVAVTFRCNYHGLCPYCHLQDLGLPSRYPSDLPFREFLSFLQDLPPCTLDLTGGEPFLARGFREFLGSIPRKHRVAVATNLSFPPEEFAEVLGRFCHITASYHPHAVELGTFLERLERLRSLNPKISVNLVAHPSLLPSLKEYLRIFNRRGIPVHVDPYVNPLSPYSPEERELVRGALVSRREVEFPFGQERRWCTAGTNHFAVAPNGDVYTCWQGMMWSHLLSLREPYYLGNLLEGNFSLRKEGILCELPCPSGCDLDYVRWRAA